jgi:hypothetical protein
MSASRSAVVAAALFAASLAGGTSAPETTPVMTRSGACDASGAVAVGPGTFVVASDEDNVLRVYGPDGAKPQAGALDVSAFLGVAPGGSEADIEGATRIGDVIYWITSHGADKKGRLRESGRRLFATQVAVAEGRAQFTPLGTPYETLVQDLVADPGLHPLGLKAAAKRAPKTPNALNIEGLTATPEGGLLIGFRNPIPQGKALVVPLLNPNDVVMGKAKAKLGPPILLSLAGLGIRSIEYSAGRGEYLIVAGPDGVTGPFHLYRWAGSKSDAPIEVPGVSFAGLQPEALIVYPDNAKTIEILSDDGTRDIRGVACKDLPVDQRVFRSLRVSF